MATKKPQGKKDEPFADYATSRSNAAQALFRSNNDPKYLGADAAPDHWVAPAARPDRRQEAIAGARTAFYNDPKNEQFTGSSGFAEAVKRRNQALLKRDLAKAYDQGAANSEYAATKRSKYGVIDDPSNRLHDRMVLARTPKGQQADMQQALDDARSAGDAAQALQYEAWYADERRGRTREEAVKNLPDGASQTWAENKAKELTSSKPTTVNAQYNPANTSSKGSNQSSGSAELPTLTSSDRSLPADTASGEISTNTFTSDTIGLGYNAPGDPYYNAERGGSFTVNDDVAVAAGIGPKNATNFSISTVDYEYDTDAPKHQKNTFTVKVTYWDPVSRKTKSSYKRMNRKFKVSKVLGNDNRYYDISFDKQGRFVYTLTVSQATAQIASDAAAASMA